MEFVGNSIGIIAGSLSFLAYLLYVVDMIRGRCRPNRMTWWTLTVIGLMVAISYYASGARQTMWVALAYVAGPLIVSLLSFRYGRRRVEPIRPFLSIGSGGELTFVVDI